MERGGQPHDDEDEVLGDDEVIENETEHLDAQEGADAEVGSTSARGPQAVPGTSTKEQSGPRFINFLRACWAELQRVQWPDRRQVGQATAVVLGFVVFAGAYLGFADFVAQEIVDLIL